MADEGCPTSYEFETFVKKSMMLCEQFFITYLTEAAFFWDNARDFIVEEIYTHHQCANNEHLRHENATKLIRVTVISRFDFDGENIFDTAYRAHVLFAVSSNRNL